MTHRNAPLTPEGRKPRHQPTATAPAVAARIEDMRRTHKWSTSRIAFELESDGIAISRHGDTAPVGPRLNHRRFIDPQRREQPGQPPASRLREGVSNVLASYTWAREFPAQTRVSPVQECLSGSAVAAAGYLARNSSRSALT
ncbi:hypothetical protein Atai01_16360 [Amycolatopsis taiwanensis]|uniref:Uncharacterized protein n=1 Tax=Amycolatopsis taiwanensis TaxID=342230 RepID=A0A9W6VF11_9PSEU|nr:hypothetical protein Atai01_16360 [Amycolatopsis taiwanensis]